MFNRILQSLCTVAEDTPLIYSVLLKCVEGLVFFQVIALLHRITNIKDWQSYDIFWPVFHLLFLIKIIPSTSKYTFGSKFFFKKGNFDTECKLILTILI